MRLRTQRKRSRAVEAEPAFSRGSDQIRHKKSAGNDKVPADMFNTSPDETGLMHSLQRLALTQLGYFVFQEQFTSLEFMQFKFIRGRMNLLLLDFTLERQVTAFEFGEMALQ